MSHQTPASALLPAKRKRSPKNLNNLPVGGTGRAVWRLTDLDVTTAASETLREGTMGRVGSTVNERLFVGVKERG